MSPGKNGQLENKTYLFYFQVIVSLNKATNRWEPIKRCRKTIDKKNKQIRLQIIKIITIDIKQVKIRTYKRGTWLRFTE